MKTSLHTNELVQTYQKMSKLTVKLEKQQLSCLYSMLAIFFTEKHYKKLRLQKKWRKDACS